MIVINIEEAAVEKDKYVGVVMLSHGYFPSRDIFGSYFFRVKTVSGRVSCNALAVVPGAGTLSVSTQPKAAAQFVSFTVTIS